MADKTLSDQIIKKTIIINALPAKVWNVLTDQDLMKEWMSETEIDIITDWEVGSAIIIRGDLHTAHFQNKGMVLKFVPNHILQYSHLSSLSNLADTVENYSIIGFELAPKEDQTILTLTLSNFPTESIYRHFEFYWGVTIELLKKFVEI